jgi:hypothetical protein
MARPAVLKIDILADGKSARAELDRTGRSGGKLGSAMKAGAAIAAVAVISIGTAAVQAASAVEQGTGAAAKVFKSYSDGVVKNADRADRALGLSKSGYLDLANVIGSQLKNAGTPMSKLTGETDKLITKGADLAATFGGTTKDAVDALSSALKGELDPIERYGVSIKQSDVNARLAEQGLDKLTGAAAKTAQQQALLALINEQTADSTGAFASESNTAAGVGARASAVYENLKATLGAGLLPILVVVGTFFLDKIVPAVRTASASLSASFGPAATRVGALMTGRVVPALRQLWSWFMTKLYPGIRQGVVPIVSAVRDRFTVLSAAIERNRPAISKVVNVLRVIAEFMAGKVVPIVGRVIAVFFRMQTGALSVVIDAIGRLVNGISSAVGWFQRLIDKIGSVSSKIRNSGIGSLVGKVGSLFGSSVAPGSVVAGRLRPGALSAAGGPGALASLMPSFTVSAPDVAVFIGEREITDVVRVELRKSARAEARRQTVMGG